MDIAGVQKGITGMAIFDMWMDSVRKARGKRKLQGSPLIAAVNDAFEGYVRSVEIGNAAMIASVAGTAGYSLNPGGTSVNPVSTADIAPFLALNVVA